MPSHYKIENSLFGLPLANIKLQIEVFVGLRGSLQKYFPCTHTFRLAPLSLPLPFEELHLIQHQIRGNGCQACR